MEIHKTAKARNPDVVLFPLYAVDSLGRERVQSGELWEAIQLFKLNIVAYPHSPIGYHSLANACLDEGDREQAIKYGEQALQHIDEDPTLSQDTRDYVRGNVARILQQLRPTGTK